MNKKHLLSAVLLCSTLSATSCGLSGQKTESQPADSIAAADTTVAGEEDLGADTDYEETVFQFETPEAKCYLTVDMPVGRNRCEQNIRAEIVKLLKTLCDVSNYGQDIPAREIGTVPAGNKAILEHFGNIYINDLKAYNIACSADNAEGETQQYIYELKLNVYANTPRYITYTFSSYQYIGGAHGASSAFDILFVEPSGRRLQHSIDPSHTRAMQPLLREYLLEYMHQGNSDITEAQMMDVLELQDGLIPLPQNTPVPTEDGLKFSYQTYEIGPKFLGSPTFYIPTDKVWPYMTEEAKALFETEEADMNDEE